MSKEEIKKQIGKILEGIDMDECETIGDANAGFDGWWETSAGATFGKAKLKELFDFIDTIKQIGE